MKNQRGQMLVESILIFGLLFLLSTLFFSLARNNELLAQVVSSPWLQLSGLLENGVWGSAEDTAAYHPEGPERTYSMEGDYL